MEDFSYIGLSHYFGQADFFMSELLLNELWFHYSADPSMNIHVNSTLKGNLIGFVRNWNI